MSHKLNEAELGNKAAVYAGEYVEKAFSGGNFGDKSKMMNYIAHGYYMGYREHEKSKDPRWFKRLLRPKALATNAKIEDASISVSDAYLNSKGFEHAPFHEKAFVRATFCTGFVEGYGASKNARPT